MHRLILALTFLAAFMVSPRAQSTESPDVTGDWSLTTISPVGENTNNMAISRGADGVLKADAKSAQGQRPYDRFAMEGTTVTLVITVDFQGSPMVITYTGTTDGKVMNGSADFGGLARGTWSAARVPATPSEPK